MTFSSHYSFHTLRFTNNIPGALCPKVKEGFRAAGVDVSFLSAGLPKLYGGGGFSVGALSLPKVKPPEAAGAGAASASDGVEEAAASFFSSGFPKVNV